MFRSRASERIRTPCMRAEELFRLHLLTYLTSMCNIEMHQCFAGYFGPNSGIIPLELFWIYMGITKSRTWPVNFKLYSKWNSKSDVKSRSEAAAITPMANSTSTSH
ncbi:hypothetical protein KIL84_012705 [Mauremys mutica]|uniref:Uncharacterized protein n=1 Tax=Mauremys mutica TaxID=74926 RepID=A0A9D3XNJ5_9SAUR|nr:hypothetical protein KIL84_012705 [Mauremys mutica]